MSKLYHTEQGRVMSTLGEELTLYRHARKTLELPATTRPGRLFVLARPHPGHKGPLRVAINGRQAEPIMPGSAAGYQWYDAPLYPDAVRAGINLIDFCTDATAMTGWALAIEGGTRSGSLVSDDAGVTWRAERIGYLNAQIGEYVVRARLAEGDDPSPPAPIWENRDHPRMASLLQQLPTAARWRRRLLDRVRALTAWLSSSWEHTNANRAAQYTPWDAETILAWGSRQEGHDGRLPITMCVHYSVAFVTACQALGIAARCAVFTDVIGSPNGHFAAEVWWNRLKKWIYVDPNLDLLFVRNGVPMSVKEIQTAGSDLRAWAAWGPGARFQRSFPGLEAFVQDNVLKGLFIRHRSVWPRSDFLSRPEMTPPGHGSTAYCETDLVWERSALDSGFGMFPYFGTSDYFDAAPGWP